MIKKTTYSDARANLGKLMDQVTASKKVVVISRKNSEDVALISAAELSSLMETLYLFGSPNNAKRLTTALKEADSKKTKPCTLAELRAEMGI